MPLDIHKRTVISDEFYLRLSNPTEDVVWRCRKFNKAVPKKVAVGEHLTNCANIIQTPRGKSEELSLKRGLKYSIRNLQKLLTCLHLSLSLQYSPVYYFE